MAQAILAKTGKIYTPGGVEISSPDEYRQGIAQGLYQAHSGVAQDYTPNANLTKISSPSELANYTNVVKAANGVDLYGIPKVPSSLTTDQLSNTGSIATVPNTTSNNSSFVNSLGSLSGVNSEIDKLYGNTLPSQTERTKLQSALMSAIDKLSGKGARQQEILDQNNYSQNISKLQELNTLIAQKTADYNSKLTELQGGNGLGAIIGGRTYQVERQKAVEIGNMSALAQAYQGNITLAQNVAQQTVDIEFQDEQNEIDKLKLQLELNAENLSAEEKQRAEKLQILLNERQSILDEQKAEKSQVQELMIAAAQNGAPLNVTTAIGKVTTVAEALKLAGQYLKNTEYSSGIIGEYQYYADQVKAAGGTPVGFNEYQNMDANRKIAIQKAGIAGMDSALANIAINYGSKFDSSAIVKQFNEVQNKKLGIDQILAGNQTGPGDVALVYDFMKALDPSSVVRESEYAMGAKSGNIFTGAMAQFNGVFKSDGGKLSDEVKRNFQTIINQRYNAVSQQYNNLYSETARKMRAAGISDPSMFLTNYSQVTELSDDEARNKISSIYNSNKSAQKMINDLFNQSYSPQDILQVLDDRGFNQVGGDTNTAVLSKATSKNDGTRGGQCGRFVNNLTGLGLGDSYDSKMAKMDSSITTPKPGMVFVMPYKDTGHTGIILSISNGVATVKDSNYSLDEKIKTHQIPVSKMTGFRTV